MRYCALYAPAQPKQGEPLGFIAHVARDFAAPAAILMHDYDVIIIIPACVRA